VFSSCDFHVYNFFKMTLHTNNGMSRKETVASASTVMTSSRKYWYQARSSTAERQVRRSLVSDHVLNLIHGLFQ